MQSDRLERVAGVALVFLCGGFTAWQWLGSATARAEPPQWLCIGMGAAMLLLGIWLLRAAWRAQRRFRAILRA